MDTIDGNLVEVAKGKAKGKQFTDEQKARFYSEMLHYCREKGYKPGWVYHKFTTKYKHPPAEALTRFATPIPPSAETLAYIRHLHIRYSYSQRNRSHKYGEPVTHQLDLSNPKEGT